MNIPSELRTLDMNIEDKMDLIKDLLAAHANMLRDGSLEYSRDTSLTMTLETSFGTVQVDIIHAVPDGNGARPTVALIWLTKVWLPGKPLSKRLIGYGLSLCCEKDVRRSMYSKKKGAKMAVSRAMKVTTLTKNHREEVWKSLGYMKGPKPMPAACLTTNPVGATAVIIHVPPTAAAKLRKAMSKLPKKTRKKSS